MARAARQKEMILAHLKLGYPLSVKEALLRYGIFGLSQRCGELRRMGYPIEARMVEVKEGCRVAEYRLAP